LSNTIEKRALKILFDTFWSSVGWKQNGLQGLNAEDFAYAKSKRLMFDPVLLNHSDAVVRLSSLVKQLTKRQVADAFLASLSTRRLDWRSPLGSYAVFQQMPLHDTGASENQCESCGFYLNDAKHDFNVLSFERQKWGGVRHDHVEYAILDLELFLEADSPKPTQQDFQIFQEVIDSISTAPASATSSTLHSHFAGTLKSNKAERDTIVAILGFCGILGTPEHRGYTDAFVAKGDRRLPDRHFVDMNYPACWWNGMIGINQSELQTYFAHAMRDAA
jgi:hypothetical protein